MSAGQMVGLIWIAGWTLTAWVFVRVRERYAKTEWRSEDAQVRDVLDAFSSNPPTALVLMLLLWPVCLVSFLAMLILPWAERKLEEAEDELKKHDENNPPREA